MFFTFFFLFFSKCNSFISKVAVKDEILGQVRFILSELCTQRMKVGIAFEVDCRSAKNTVTCILNQNIKIFDIQPENIHFFGDDDLCVKNLMHLFAFI